MRTASTAEWILCRVTTQQRAASIVGDLVELESRKGLLWFWLSVAGVAFSLIWRPLLAFIAALYSGAWTFSGFVMAIVGVNAQHRPPEYPWMPVFNVLIFIGSTLWAVSFYAAIRYGFRDRATQMAFVWAGLVTTVIYFWWQPVVLGLCIAAVVLVAVLSLFDTSYGKSSLLVLAFAAFGATARFLAIFPAMAYQHILYRGPWGDREYREHPSLIWAMFCMQILSLWLATTAWSRTLDRRKPNESFDTEAAGPLV